MNVESELKKKLRAELRARVQLISPEWRKHHSAQVCALVRQQKAWHEAKTILFYAALPAELDVHPLMIEARGQGKTVLLPRFEAANDCYSISEVIDFERDLVPAKFGILEPRAGCSTFLAKRLDFALVPGVGFDPLGARLGRGRGFYDRLLAQISGVKCGIAYDEQIVPRIPTALHDVTMDFVVTPTRWLLAR